MTRRLPARDAGGRPRKAPAGKPSDGAPDKNAPARNAAARNAAARNAPAKNAPAKNVAVDRPPAGGVSAQREPKSARLFFALWPSPAMQAALAAAAEPAVVAALTSRAGASAVAGASVDIGAGAAPSANASPAVTASNGAPASPDATTTAGARASFGATTIAGAPASSGATTTAGAPARPGAPSSPRRVPATNYHLTLAFLGSVPLTRLPDLDQVATRFAQAAASVLATPFDIVLDTLDHWRKPQVLVATATDTPPAAIALAEGLQRALVDAGFTPDLKPFRVHATIARKVRRVGRELHMDPVRWSFDSMHLVESQTHPDGSAYRPVKKWVLDKRD